MTRERVILFARALAKPEAVHFKIDGRVHKPMFRIEERKIYFWVDKRSPQVKDAHWTIHFEDTQLNQGEARTLGVEGDTLHFNYEMAW